MDIVLGRLQAHLERPQTRKFALPIVVLPELFTDSRHLTLLAGHLVSLGWETYLLDVHKPLPLPLPKHGLSSDAFATLVDDIRMAVEAIGSDVVAGGHGFGGLLALKLAEAPLVRAGVALAPLIPGFRSPLLVRRHRWRWWRSEATALLSGRTRLELVAEAEPFQRETLIRSLIPVDTSAAMEFVRGVVQLEPHQVPRLILASQSDAFAPCEEAERLAIRIGAQFVSLPGRGHWIIAGRMLSRTIADVQRFLVKALGEELLLLYDENDKDDAAG